MPDKRVKTPKLRPYITLNGVVNFSENCMLLLQDQHSPPPEREQTSEEKNQTQKTNYNHKLLEAVM